MSQRNKGRRRLFFLGGSFRAATAFVPTAQDRVVSGQRQYRAVVVPTSANYSRCGARKPQRCIDIPLTSCCDHSCLPGFYERSESVEGVGEIVSGGGEAEAEMRGCVEAIAGSEQDSALGGGLAERALLFSAHQPWEGGHAALRRNPAKHVAMVAHEALEQLEVS